VVDVRTVKALDSPLLDPFGVVHTSIRIGEMVDESYSYWYPSDRPQVGKSYEFHILKGTDIVILIKLLQL
jgi:hypothetical protein